MNERGRRGAPAVSVIVPVRNRRVLLRNLLDGLARQTFKDFEVIVVDDASSDGSTEEAAAAARNGMALWVVASPGRGAVAARGAGVAIARGEYLAFTDSDCVPDPGWLAAGVAALAADADVVEGRTIPDRPPRALERSLAAGEEGLYPTCNVFYRKESFAAAGGFDRLAGRRLRFRAGRSLAGVGFGEDTLVGWQVRRAGRAAYAPDALVRHHVFPPDARESLRRAWSMGAFPGLVREVPELRETMLVGGLFLGGPGRVGLYAAALCAAAGRRRAAAASVAVWAAGRAAHVSRQEGSITRAAAALPLELATEAYATLALLLGNVRARTIVL